MIEMLVRYAHFVGIMVLTSMLVAEHLLLKDRLSPSELKRLFVIDAVYGGAAAIVLGAGLCLWWWLGKPPEYYSGNYLFHAKLTAFFIVGGLSAYPTVFFIKHRRSVEQSIAVPQRVIWLIRGELIVLASIPLLAVMMANGYGSASAT